MSTRITCAYTVNLTGTQSQATINKQLAAVPLDLSLPRDIWGAIPTSDVTSNPDATHVKRQITMTFDDGATAAITPTLDNAGHVIALTLGAVAGWWAAVPLLQFARGFPVPAPAGAILTPAQATAIMGVGTAVIANGGTGYNGGTTSAVLVGGALAPGGTPAVLGAVTLGVGGVVTGVAITSAGSGYTVYPTIQIVDTAAVPGSGAEVFGGLTVVGVTLTNQGYGYQSVPTVNVNPLLPALGGNAGLPPSGGQDPGSFKSWMSGIIRQALKTPVFTAQPVYS